MKILSLGTIRYICIYSPMLGCCTYNSVLYNICNLLFITWRCLLLSCRDMRLALQPKGIRTEALTRTDEMESLTALMMEDIGGVMTGKGKINEKLPKASY